MVGSGKSIRLTSHQFSLYTVTIAIHPIVGIVSIVRNLIAVSHAQLLTILELIDTCYNPQDLCVTIFLLQRQSTGHGLLDIQTWSPCLAGLCMGMRPTTFTLTKDL